MALHPEPTNLTLTLFCARVHHRGGADVCDRSVKDGRPAQDLVLTHHAPIVRGNWYQLTEVCVPLSFEKIRNSCDMILVCLEFDHLPCTVVYEKEKQEIREGDLNYWQIWG